MGLKPFNHFKGFSPILHTQMEVWYFKCLKMHNVANVLQRNQILIYNNLHLNNNAGMPYAGAMPHHHIPFIYC